MHTLLSSLLRSAFAISVVALAAVAVAFLGRPDRPKLDRAPPKARVEVQPAKRHDGAFQFEVDGVVIPFREVDVAAEVGGRVIYKSPQCRPGRLVREGDLLVRIDPTDYELEIQRLEQEVQQNLGALDELQAERESTLQQIQLAEEDLEIRRGELARFEQAPDRSVFSKVEIDTARRNELAARNTWLSLKDQVKVLNAREGRLKSAVETARTQLRRAELDKERCEIRARISGSIVSESVEQEGFVEKGGMLLSIRDTSRMEVRCNLRMQQLQWLWDSQSERPRPAAATAEEDADAAADPQLTEALEGYGFPSSPAKVVYELADTAYAWQGRLARYANSGVDERTRMIPCIVEVQEPQRVTLAESGAPAGSGAAPPALLTGMFVKVQIRAELPRPLVELPPSAVGPGGDIWLVDDEKLRRVRGEVLHADDQRVLLERTDELALDALVVTSPLVNPLEGYPVRIVNSADRSEPRVAGAGSSDASPVSAARQATGAGGGSGTPPGEEPDS